MALRKIARMGHPVLRTRAGEIDPATPGLDRLIKDMAETMVDARGIGLAAPQIYERARVIVFQKGLEDLDREPGSERPSAPDLVIQALINPTWQPVGDATEDDWEGCLSIPGLRGKVPRAAHIRFRGQKLSGDWIEGEAKGLDARVIQHEVDHLDGVLFLDRMTDLASLIFETEWQAYRQGAAGDAGEAGGGT